MRETYRLLQECAVDELHGTVRVLTHERTGARILTIKNNDKKDNDNIFDRSPCSPVPDRLYREWRQS